MTNDIQIVRLSGQAKDVNRFLRIGYGVYRHDPFWVAPMLGDLKKTLSQDNPFFQHAEMGLWVASRHGQDIGRIAGIIDHSYNTCQNEKTAFFGFFESHNDPQASHQLFEAVHVWARQKQLRRMLGPMNPSTNDECGLLVEGFDSSPVFMMTYNPPYYVDLVLAEGFQKAKDLLAFYIDLRNNPLDRLQRIANGISQRSNNNLTVRPIRRKTLQSDLAKIKEVYNSAWQENWGFVPMTDAEIDFMAQRLRPMLVEGLVWITETPDQPVGFLVAVPDFNQAIKPLRGRFLTLRLLGFMPYLFGWRRPRLARLILLGTKKPFRRRGVESLMLAEGLKFGLRAGFRACEASWILEDNIKVQQLIALFGGKPYKVYRIYEREL
jgi:hypothetical protein